MMLSKTNIFEHTIRILVIFLLLISIIVYPKSSRWSVFIIVVSLLILVLFSSIPHPHKLNKKGKSRGKNKHSSNKYHTTNRTDDASSYTTRYDLTAHHTSNNHNIIEEYNDDDEGKDTSYVITDATGYSQV